MSTRHLENKIKIKPHQQTTGRHIFLTLLAYTDKISLHWYTKMSMKVSIPQGAQPGSVFQVQQPDGQIISIQVPPGN